jgi:UDP-N-acetylmuramoylalanine--D-glutamate ligase
MINFKDQHIFILGLGLSSIAAAKKLDQLGANITLYDDYQDIDDIKDQYIQDQLEKKHISYCHYNQINWQNIDLLLLAPAIATNFPKPHLAVSLAKKFNVKITIDIELFVNLLPKAQIIAVTGTNGKSTTASLIYHLLKQNKQNVYLGGNIGVAVFDLPINNDHDNYYILELSSYQSELIDKASFNIAILLNISPDHIDRHGNMKNYIAAKANIFKNSRSNQQFICAIDDKASCKIANKLTKYISLSEQNKAANIYAQNDIINIFAEKISFSSEKFTHYGNKINVLAVFAIAKILHIPFKKLIEDIANFKSLPHRMELIGNIKQVKFFNDSKATNAESSYNAITQLDDIYWIAGGVAKDKGIEIILPKLNNVQKIYLIGQDKDYFARQLEQVNFTNYSLYDDLTIAVKQAYYDAKLTKKANILFSPAAASFDNFDNFAQRGQVFCKVFTEIKQ